MGDYVFEHYHYDHDSGMEKLKKEFDLISRAAMKNMITNHWSDFSNAANYRAALACVDAVPTITPTQPEIIYCKDCKHRDPEDKKCDCGHDIQWQLPRQDDWVCADAERREVTT